MTCERCGVEFVPKRPRPERTLRYCSRRCGAIAASAVRITPPKPCEWCGEPFKGRSPRYRFCSHSCANASSAKRGPEHPHYNGGLSFNTAARRWIVYGRGGYQTTYARIVMAAHLGRDLWPDEVVHHINGDTTDDRIENLLLTTRAEHIRIHMDDLIAGRP